MLTQDVHFKRSWHSSCPLATKVESLGNLFDSSVMELALDDRDLLLHSMVDLTLQESIGDDQPLFNIGIEGLTTSNVLGSAGCHQNMVSNPWWKLTPDHIWSWICMCDGPKTCTTGVWLLYGWWASSRFLQSGSFTPASSVSTALKMWCWGLCWVLSHSIVLLQWNGILFQHLLQTNSCIHDKATPVLDGHFAFGFGYILRSIGISIVAFTIAVCLNGWRFQQLSKQTKTCKCRKHRDICVWKWEIVDIWSVYLSEIASCCLCCWSFVAVTFVASSSIIHWLNVMIRSWILLWSVTLKKKRN